MRSVGGLGRVRAALIFPQLETEWDIHDTASSVHSRLGDPGGDPVGGADQSRIAAIASVLNRRPGAASAPGERFAPVADAVGLLREATYRQQLSGSGDQRDLDGRDSHYDHLLLIEPGSGALAGAARLQFLPKHCETDDLPDGSQSYLEHVYPGIKARLTSLGNHLEIGRVALASRFQKQPHSLMALFRGGLLIAARSGYDTLHGLVSYNHFAHSEPSIRRSSAV